MILKSIRLCNIRSYLEQKIDFPDGSVVLSGDIGSGKSTILLSIEFALFGLKKGELSGSSLLRHGKREGSVELNFESDGKSIIIKRNLKRANTDIKQDSGYILIDGVKKDCTSEELKAAVLDILGYPKEFLKKKDFIYRYTVYTPQEEMKRIIHEDKDSRLDTLRKVFNIDKYKRITENSRILSSFLREKKRSLEGFTLDTELKKTEFEKRKDDIFNSEKKICELMPKLESAENLVKKKKKEIEGIEDSIAILNSLKKDFHVLEAGITIRNEQLKINESRALMAEKSIESLKKETEGREILDSSILAGLISKKEEEAIQIERKHRDAIRKIQDIKSGISFSMGQSEKIESIGVCPLCEQNVSHEHKSSIKARETKKITELEDELKSISAVEKELELKLGSARKEKESLRKKEAEFSLILHKRKSIDEKSSELIKISSLQEQTKNEINIMLERKNSIASRIKDFEESEKNYRSAKSELDSLMRNEKEIEIEMARIEREKEITKGILFRLQEEITAKELGKKELGRIISLENWTNDFFVNLIGTIEKHAFVKIHGEFSSLFKEWFDMLMEDESLSVRLDDEFSPVIEQNGYETSADNLSGGEKTSLALAYRLALNKVINDIVSTIRTKDIIILDEPTDGFSSEQLDKMREVIEQLGMKQIIIVSHEGKIESFVQHVIRISKEGHVSSVF